MWEYLIPLFELWEGGEGGDCIKHICLNEKCYTNKGCLIDEDWFVETGSVTPFSDAQPS
jgi:hypothetical protein